MIRNIDQYKLTKSWLKEYTKTRSLLKRYVQNKDLLYKKKIDSVNTQIKLLKKSIKEYDANYQYENSREIRTNCILKQSATLHE